MLQCFERVNLALVMLFSQYSNTIFSVRQLLSQCFMQICSKRRTGTWIQISKNPTVSTYTWQTEAFQVGIRLYLKICRIIYRTILPFPTTHIFLPCIFHISSINKPRKILKGISLHYGVIVEHLSNMVFINCKVRAVLKDKGYSARRSVSPSAFGAIGCTMG